MHVKCQFCQLLSIFFSVSFKLLWKSMHELSESLDYLFTVQWDDVFYTNKHFLLYSLQLVWMPPYKPERAKKN